jgi:hypothetical protein
MQKRRFLGALSLIILLVLVGGIWQSAGALSVKRITFEEMTRRAKTIIHARCLSTSTVMDGKLPFTYYTFSIIQVLKGDDKATEIKLKQIGGSVNGVDALVPDIPKFDPNEEVILFLTDKSKFSGLPIIIGAFQGKLRVQTEVDSGQKYVELNTLDAPGRKYGLIEFFQMIKETLKKVK